MDDKIKKVAGNYDKAFSVLGGMIVGKGLEKLLDKTITSPTVQGLVGVELSKDLSKYVKPLIVTGTGLAVFTMSTNEHLKYAGIGMSGIGLSEIANVVTGKDYLAGFGENGDYQYVDIQTGRTIPPAPQLELPELTGLAVLGADDDTFDNINNEDYNDAYQQISGTDNIPYVEEYADEVEIDLE